MTPTALTMDVYEVTHALGLIRRKAALPPGELRLLSWLVGETLAGREPAIHQRSIAEAVFGRNLADFDPRADSIVRTTATNLRENLQLYYAGPGQGDPLTIELPRGSYIPVFRPRAPLSAHGTSRLWSARAAMEARTASGFKTAIASLDAVLAESPSLSLALALKAEALASQAIHGARPRPNLEAARVLALQALDQPRPVWQAWLSHAIVKQALDLDWNAASEAYRMALELSGGEAATHVWYTAFLVGRGKPKESVGHLQRAVEHFGYNNPTCIGDLAIMLILARDHEAARVTIESALEAAPNHYQHHVYKALLLEATGDPAAAMRVLDYTPLTVMERPTTWGLRAFFSGRLGSPAAARRRLSWMRTAVKMGGYVPQHQVAAAAFGAGDPDEAVRCLERGVEDRDPLTVWFWAYPMMRHLYDLPAYQRMIDQLGLVRY